MCFSATASFVAGASLSAIGVATIREARGRNEMPFAMIPALFGIQQLIEGVLWLSISHGAPQLQQATTYAYSFFSHVLWPIYVPFAFRCLETTPWRRKAMLWFQAAGLIVGLYLLFFLITAPLVSRVEGGHIVYESPHFYIAGVMALYLLATCFTGFVSSHKFVRVFGVLALLSFIFSWLAYTRALVSVWCFFAAILSVLIFVHLRFRQLGGFPKAQSSPA
jgi:hypothetical protein